MPPLETQALLRAAIAEVRSSGSASAMAVGSSTARSNSGPWRPWPEPGRSDARCRRGPLRKCRARSRRDNAFDNTLIWASAAILLPTRAAAWRPARQQRPGRQPRASTDSMTRSPGSSRTDSGTPRPGAMCGRRRAAYAMTAAGTRKPRSSTSTSASGLPRCASDSSHDAVAHGVVPCAMSPSTVAEPVEQRRRPRARCIGERSWASSRMTWPRLWCGRQGRPSSRGRGRRGTTGRLSACRRGWPWQVRCSSTLKAGRRAGRATRRRSWRMERRFGSTVGQSVAAYCRTSGAARDGVLDDVVEVARRAPMASRTRCANRCGSIAPAAP